MKTKQNHIRALASISNGRRPPESILRCLRRLENRANAAATAQCNGELYRGQPYRDEAAWERFIAHTTAEVGRILGYVPRGLFVNSDPRGYSLKIEGEIPEGMHTDWGGYGILAPDFT